MKKLRIPTIIVLLLVPMLVSGQTPRRSGLTIQVWVEGEQRSAMVSINGVGYLLRTSPLITPNPIDPNVPTPFPDNPIPIPIPTPIDPAPTPTPPKPPKPNIPKGSLEYYSQEYMKAVVSPYEISYNDLLNGEIKANHKSVLERIGKITDSRSKQINDLSDSYLKEITPLIDANQNIKDVRSYADVLKRVFDSMKTTYQN